MSEESPRVLCVDLDGTLITTDLLWESLLSVARHRPWLLVAAPAWLLRGRAYLKQRLAAAAQIDFTTLPYCHDVLTFVRSEHQKGRTIVLATGSDEALASGVSRHLQVFNAILASDGVTNLTGRIKAAHLVNRFGSKNFDYIGNSSADVPCWESAATSFAPADAPTARPGLLYIGERRPRLGSTLRSLAHAMRPHQWLKNVLLFVAPFAAHRLDWPTASALLFAFVSLALVASGGYVLNDLLDVAADRAHARKRTRPFASGLLSLPAGLLLLGVLWAAGFGLAAATLSQRFVLLLAIYLVGSCAYSLRLKREAILDVMVLAGMYVLRVVAGGVATGVPISTWFLAFTLFVSLSLAFLKRFIEANALSREALVPGRGYQASDAPLLQTAGMASAYMSAVVLAIYANNPDVTRLYNHPERLLLMCPVLVYWASRVWLKASRGTIHDDPVVAVARDAATYVLLAISAGVVLMAAL